MMISDIHSHILPGIDDGSGSLQESLELLRLEAEQGIRRVAATPHFYPQRDTPEAFLKRRARAEAQLREELQKNGDLPEIVAGAEVYFFPGISQSECLEQLTIGSGRYLLLEMPMAPWTDAMYREMEGICTNFGITPVIAHVDRYISPFRTHGIPERLTQLPVLVQANASFFLKRSTRNMAIRMLRSGKIHVLGSDCHNLTHRRPNLAEAVQVIQNRLGAEALDQIRQYEEEILAAR